MLIFNIGRDLLVAVSLVLVMEGIFPFLNPVKWKNFMTILIKQSDKNLRFMGLISMIFGIILLYIVN